jgi:polar amino acid transport system substrate-binding protein
MAGYIFMIMMLFGLCSELNAKELRIAASAYLSEPYTIYEKGELRGGLIKDIFDSLGTEFAVKIQYKDVPRKRVEAGLMAGEIHIAPVARPQWLSKSFAGQWTEPVFRIKELLVVHAQSKLNYRGPDDLKGLRIGTILGYHYPLADAYFQAGTATRWDVQKADQNLDMLLKKRVDACLMHDLVFRYFQKTNPRASHLRAFDVEPEFDVFWAVSPKTSVPVERLNSFIRETRKSGRLDQFLSRYRPPESRDQAR